MAVMLELT